MESGTNLEEPDRIFMSPNLITFVLDFLLEIFKRDTALF